MPNKSTKVEVMKGPVTMFGIAISLSLIVGLLAFTALTLYQQGRLFVAIALLGLVSGVFAGLKTRISVE